MYVVAEKHNDGLTGRGYAHDRKRSHQTLTLKTQGEGLSSQKTKRLSGVSIGQVTSGDHTLTALSTTTIRKLRQSIIVLHSTVRFLYLQFQSVITTDGHGV